MQRHSNKEIDKFLRSLSRQGWTSRSGKKGHICIISPKGSLVSISGSPSCPYALHHVKKDVERVLKQEAEK